MKMNLHRTEKHPEWELYAPEQRNRWQKLAARTKGVVTPGNAVTAFGAGLFSYGMYGMMNGQTLCGTLAMGVGRALDIADGIVADRTKTKSPLGEAFDVTVDGAELMVGLPILVGADLLPWSVAGALVLLKSTNVGIVYAAKKAGHELHPSKIGKLSSFAQWGCAGLYGLAASRIGGGVSDFCEAAAQATSIAAIGGTTVATMGYFIETLVASGAGAQEIGLGPEQPVNGGES